MAPTDTSLRNFGRECRESQDGPDERQSELPPHLWGGVGVKTYSLKFFFLLKNNIIRI